MRERVYLPPEAKRGYNVSRTKKGWRIVNPNLSRTFKAVKVVEFNALDGDTYLLFRIVTSKRD
jgi:hypothetical protein